MGNSEKETKKIETKKNGTKIKETSVIWVEQNINSEENREYITELLTLNNLKINAVNNIESALELIKFKKFKDIIVITSGRFYNKFIEGFKQNIQDMYVIPLISVFTTEATKTKHFLKFDLDISFYNYGGVQTTIKGVIKMILKQMNNEGNVNNKKLLNQNGNINLNYINARNKEEEKNDLTFEYIDRKEKLVLPLYYKSLIEISENDNIEAYTEYLYKKYSSNEEIKNLLSSIISIPDIPIELLSKYYARVYTIESDFYKDLNKDLRESRKENYITFIKILYEGVRLKSLPLANNKILYRGSKIANKEIERIKKSLKEKKEDLPGVIVFSKTFLSFTQIIDVAKLFFNNPNDNKALSKVLYIIEKDYQLDYSLATHSDIAQISKFESEKEVLFFPFSSFEIKEINEKIVDEENIYEIKLKYLGKYLKEINDLDKNIPNDSEFKKQMIDIGLIPDKKLEKSKEIIQHYQEYKENVDQIIDKSNEIEIKYIVNGKNEIRIFGNEFVVNNRDKCKIVFKGKEHDLVEHFKIPDYTDENEKLTELVIKLRYIKNITDLSCMFHWCSALISISDLYKLDLECIHSTSYMFSECSSLRSLPNISNWNTINITNMSYMFHKCSSLNSLPDISKWNTKNVSDMSKMFYNCSSLDELPDLSNWNTINVVNMEGMFSWCKSLISLPNISYWNTNNVSNMSNLFNGCQSLTSLPDISKWNLSKVTNMNEMFKNCNKNLNIPSKFIK